MMRRLGVAVLGLFSGLLSGFLLIEVIARISLGSSGQVPDSLLLGYLTPVLAILGVVLALVIDGRMRHQ
jgi:hypothetical protein